MAFIFNWLGRRRIESRTQGPAARSRRERRFERLEERLVMAGRSALYAPVAANLPAALEPLIVAAASSSSAAVAAVPTATATVPGAGNGAVQTPATPAAAVNTYDLELAVAEGLRHLQNLLDPSNNNLPFFGVWGLGASEAAKYGDNGIPVPTPRFTFDHHFVSNAAGRALWAMLAASDAFGVHVSGAAVDALSRAVLLSLHKPRNGNWNDTSAANQMITGLASDPRSYGSLRFDMTYMFNMGAGLRGALALATLSDYANFSLPGYNWSGETLFDVIVHNLRQYYVYGGGPIGGKKVYDWEVFRKQLGLQGGDRYGTSIQAETISDWSNLYKNFVDPFLVGDLVEYYEATGSQESLLLAKELRDLVFYKRFPKNVTDPTSGLDHMFEVVGEMNAYSRLALVTGDADMMERVRARYEALRGFGFSSTGWVREYYRLGSDTGEINNTTELIETALNFAAWGWTEYYADAERFTRAHLLPAQILDTSFVTAAPNATSSAQINFASRLKGAFGFPAAYGYIPTKKTNLTGVFHADVTAGAVAALADIKSAAHTYAGGVHRVNLLFDQSNEFISIETPYSGADALLVRTKTPGDVLIRIPEWADQATIAGSMLRQGFAFGFDGNYLRIVKPTVGTTIQIDFPLAAQRRTETINGRSITIDWLGDGVIAMSDLGTPLPFFPKPEAGGGVIGLPPVSSALSASAGPDLLAKPSQAIVLAGSATLNGQPSNQVTTKWSVVDGPGSASFGNVNLLATTATFSTVGQYTLRLTATYLTKTVTDDVIVTVAEAPSTNPHAPSEISFVDGMMLEGGATYFGTRDTTLNVAASGNGSAQFLDVDGDDRKAALLSWDVSTIPVGSIVIGVSIQFNVIDWTRDDYQIYALKNAWDELAANWSDRSANRPWQAAGAGGSLDRSVTAAGVVAPRSVGQYATTLNETGVAMVQQWVNDPSKNYGLVIRNSLAKDDLRLSSSEASNPALRPRLVVQYVPGATPVIPNAQPIIPGGKARISFGQSLALSAFASTPPAGAQVAWTLTLGPGPVTFSAPNAAATNLKFSKPGMYTIRATVTVGGVLTFSEMDVVVSAAFV